MPVYMIQAGNAGTVKIGFTTAPLRRLAALQTSNHARLRIIRLLEGDEDAESALHDRFADLRESGEWFRFAPEMLGEDFGYSDLPIPQPAPPLPRHRKPLPDSVFLHVRLEETLYDELKATALLDRRSMTQQMTMLLQEAIAARLSPPR